MRTRACVHACVRNSDCVCVCISSLAAGRLAQVVDLGRELASERQRCFALEARLVLLGEAPAEVEGANEVRAEPSA